MQNTVIDVVVKNQSVKKFDIIQQSMAIKALPHMDLVIRDKFSGKSPSQIKTKRQNDDLVIYTNKDDVSLIVKDYYTTDDVGILGVQGDGVASYGLNSSQASQILGGGETIHSLSNTIITDSASKNYSSYLLGLLGLGVTVGALSSNNDDDKPQPKPTTPTQPTNTPNATVKSIETNTKNVNEGNNLITTVTLDNSNGNAKVSFALSGVETADYGNATFSNGVTKNADGTLNVPKGVQTFNVTLPITADKTTEGSQNLTIKVGDKSTAVTITDTSTAPVTPPTPTPTNAVVTEVTANKSVNEGDNLVTTVKLDNTNGNAKVAFALTGVETADYGNATFSNGVTKNADGTLNVPKGVQTFSVTLPITADKTTEGNQALTVKVGDKTANITIVDTSTTPVTPPTSAVVTEVTANKSVNEGDNLVTTVKLDNTNGNAKVAFALSGVETADYGNATFSNGVTKNTDGTLNVPKGVQTFNVTLPITADKTTEGNQILSLDIGGKKVNVEVLDTSIAEPTGVTIETRSITHGLDLFGGPTPKEATSNDATYKPNGFPTFYYTDGLKTTNYDDSIRVGYVGQTDSHFGLISDGGMVDLASGNDKLEVKNGQGAGSVYLGEGNDTYITHGNIRGYTKTDDTRKYAKVFMEQGDDTFIEDDGHRGIYMTNIYLGSGSDTANMTILEKSTLDLGTAHYKHSYTSRGKNIEVDDYQQFYKDGKTSLNNDTTADTADMVNTVTIKKLQESTIRGGDANDILNIDTFQYGSDINLGNGENKVTVINNASGSIVTGKDKDEINLSTSFLNLDLGDGNNIIKVSGNQTGVVKTGKDNDNVTIDGKLSGSLDVGDGDNTIDIKGETSVSNINLGDGNNTINVAKTYVTNTFVAGDGGNTVRSSDNLAVKSLSFGAGKDILEVTGDVTGSPSDQGGQYNLGDGDNTLTVGGFAKGAYQFGNGNDTINIAKGLTQGSSLNVGAGNNSITLGAGISNTHKNNSYIISKSYNTHKTKQIPQSQAIGVFLSPINHFLHANHQKSSKIPTFNHKNQQNDTTNIDHYQLQHSQRYVAT